MENQVTISAAQARLQLRLQLREIDGRIAAESRETDRYRRAGLGREDFKLRGFNGLADERAEILERLRALEPRSTRASRTRKAPLSAWLLLPVVLPLMAVKALTPRRSEPRARIQRREQVQRRERPQRMGWQPRPRVSFDLG